MATLVYKRHTIIAGAKRDKDKSYEPTVHISWVASAGQRCVHSFTLPKSCSTFDEASGFALTAAKLWVDRHTYDLG
jgi:hypothetical protein